MINRAKTSISLITLVLLAGGAAILASGCAHRRQNPPNIPESATLRSEGRPDAVAVTSELGGGTAYLYDVTDNRLVWSGGLYADQTAAVDTNDGTITIDRHVVEHVPINPNHHYAFYFDPKPRM